MNQHTSRVAWTSLGLLSLVLCVYLPVIAGGGFFWDDHLLLLDNRLVWSPGGLFDIWFSTKNPDYFPLMSTSFWLEARLWGREAWGYHLVNALLHAGSAILLWRIFTRLKIRGALLGAILFAVTPLNVESVAWVAERKNTLSMFFACGSVLLWLRGEDKNDRRAYAGALLFFAASLLAKTAAVMLPFVLLVLAWHRRGKITARDALRAAPFFALSLALGLVTIWFQYHRAIGHDVVIRDDPFPARLATAGCAFWFYLAKALVPINLTFNYPR
jgi:4-amino-4-deoxy-L-arabinose transferase-like glycosyltransferase